MAGKKEGGMIGSGKVRRGDGPIADFGFRIADWKGKGHSA